LKSPVSTKQIQAKQAFLFGLVWLCLGFVWREFTPWLNLAVEEPADDRRTSG
jgi:hypothetical protein